MSTARRRGRSGPPSRELAALLALLGNEVRRHILVSLAKGPKDRRTLADEVGLSVSGVSHHLRRLCEADLLTAQRRGRRYVYRHGRRASAIVGREKAIVNASMPHGSRVTLITRLRGRLL